MELLDTIPALIAAKKTTTEIALQVFDTLDCVDLAFMLGRWQGFGLHTNHPMDGLLEASHWYGKEFVNSEIVHPLLFLDKQGNVFKVASNRTLMNWGLKYPVLKSKSLQPLLLVSHFLLKTEKSQARLRMMDYRGKVSATMIYDYLPINDAFRKIDDNTVLGLMDFKNSPQPFFFVLKRA